LNLNTSQTAGGKLGVALAYAAGQTMNAGTLSVVEVQFVPVVPGPITSWITFGDQPIAREIVSATADDLDAAYIAGSVTIQPMVVDPMASWRARYFSATELLDSSISGDSADPDHDGASNRQEFLAGTDPRDPQSVLKAEIRSAPVVSWPSVPGMTYRILRSTTLSASDWVPLTPSVTATNSTSVFTDLEATGQAFYRIEIVE
jgi:hypothetical protein